MMIYVYLFNWYLMMKYFNIFQNWYVFNWLVFFKLVFKNLIFFQIVKPSSTITGEFHVGGVLFKSREKHLK
jgi:hypothetical protein